MKNIRFPLYVKLYCWFFCMYAIVILIFIPISVFYPTEIRFLGIKGEPLSILGIGIVLISSLKGILAYYMLRGNVLAFKIGLIDSILSLLTILLVTAYPFTVYPDVVLERRISFEIIFIAIYLFYMIRINKSIDLLKFKNNPSF